VNRPKILFLTHRVPFPPDKGDRIRTYHTLRFLSKRADVYLAGLADEPVPEHTVQSLRALCREVFVQPLSPRGRWLRAGMSLALGRTASEGAFKARGLSRQIERWCQTAKFAATLASASSMAPYLRARCLRSIPAVVDLVDIDSQKWQDYAEASHGPKSALYRLEARRLRHLEASLAAWAQGLVVVSEAEARLFRSFCAHGSLRAISNGVDFEYFRPAPQQAGQRLIFVGALDYKPNVDGAEWFCTAVWPQLKIRFPEATIQLVGRQPTAAVKKLGEFAGVKVVGGVPDVRPYLREATAVVVPLRLGRGLQNKVLEALAMGRATVASPTALAGVRANPEQHLLMADTPDAWVRQVSRLFESPELRKQLGIQGRTFVEENHDWDRCLAPLAGVLGLDPEPEKYATVDPKWCALESRRHESCV
jgi:sugar transferase (PEP-CTERM/EpsH1 system associated)